jgi:hypothetical protein
MWAEETGRLSAKSAVGIVLSPPANQLHLLVAEPAGQIGAVAQLVRVLDCRSSGCGFESRPRRL